MSDYKIQWNISLPPVAQYAKGHMLNIAAESLEELNDYLDELANSDTLEKAVGVAASLAALSGVVPDAAKSIAAVPSESAAASSAGPDATVTQLRTCAHGKRVYKTGNSSKGKWEGYFCPEKDRNKQCEVDWVSNK